ncbi:hypothetical protein, partial [Micromonospora sp. NPDC049799]|uniref:hypothetical protein n=1 Tax=Micromonospora sp. NPDC049799 TaxID=3154741 RepID=UPI0033F9577C
CPPGPDASAAFTAETYGSGVHVRRGPARDHPVLYTVPPGCRIGLVGYCLGEKLIDGTAGTPDVRWYRLPDGGVLTSALVHGLPPAGMGPGTCHEGLPPPAAIGLTVRPAAKGRVRLAAAGPRVDVVGFAARFPADSALPDTRRWHQIALVDAAAGTDVDWAVPPVTGADPVPVVAVACLGGQGPTEVLDARSVRRDGRTVPTVLDGEQRAAAGRSACRYPDAG